MKMLEGWLIYNREDLKKNRVFANLLQQYGKTYGLSLKIIEREEMTMGISEKGNYIRCDGQEGEPAFVINRTRDSLMSRQLELLEIPVFNSFQVTDVCNDKIKTHQFVNALGIPSVRTYFYDCRYDTPTKIPINMPLIVKKVDGHGGDNVYKVESQEELSRYIEQIGDRYLVIQEICSQVGVDVRVFVVGGEIVAAIKRESKVDFRSNYSLGGGISLYEVDDRLKVLTEKILKHMACDCVGIDFIIDANGNYLFNEIEDVVGSRSLYQQSDVDLGKEYIKYIKEKLG